MHQSFYEMYSSNPIDYDQKSYSLGDMPYYANLNSSPLLVNRNNSLPQNAYSPNNGYKIEIAKGLKLSNLKDEEINEYENITHIPKETERINSPAIFYNKNLKQIDNSNNPIINFSKVNNSIADPFLNKITNYQYNDEKNINKSNFTTKNEIIIENKKNIAINTLKDKLSFLEKENLELKNNLKQLSTPKKSKETIENLLQENQKWNSLLIEKISENAQLQKKIIEISDSKNLNEKIINLESIHSNLLKQIKIKNLIQINPNIEKYEQYNKELEQKSNELDEKIKLNEISLCAEKLQNKGDQKLMNLIKEKSNEIEKIFKKINF